MTDTAVLAPGTPVWVDISSPDMAASLTFYSGLFGWKPLGEPDPRFGGYTVLGNDAGESVIGLAPMMENGHPIWTTYIGVADAADVVKRAAAAGGVIAAEPMQVAEQGTMAVIVDPTGAAVGLWQAGEMKGFGVSNKPNTICWNELGTRDMDAAIEFYKTVFGYRIKDQTTDFGRYVEWQIDGRSVGGGMPYGDSLPSHVPPMWLTYVNVSDLAASTEKAVALGGKVMNGPIDTPQGPFTILEDPTHAAFAIIQMKG